MMKLCFLFFLIENSKGRNSNIHRKIQCLNSSWIYLSREILHSYCILDKKKAWFNSSVIHSLMKRWFPFTLNFTRYSNKLVHSLDFRKSSNILPLGDYQFIYFLNMSFKTSSKMNLTLSLMLTLISAWCIAKLATSCQQFHWMWFVLIFDTVLYCMNGKINEVVNPGHVSSCKYFKAKKLSFTDPQDKTSRNLILDTKWFCKSL